MSRHVVDVGDQEWDRLLYEFADLLLTKHGIGGSRAGDYSLYEALTNEREKARQQRLERMKTS